MTRNRWLPKSMCNRGEYAGEEEFASAFECEHAGLQRLAFLLTANAEAAGKCVRLAFCQCIASSSVFKGWTLNWARRMIIRNAVSLSLVLGDQPLTDRDGDSKDGAIACIPDHSIESILDLPAFERCAYVICVLERYSTNDCALLLGRSPREINRALDRVRNRLRQNDKSGQRCTASCDESERQPVSEEKGEYSFLQS
jgi:DNA-directed RNA polymerase specialized sigma24 family protein